MSKSTFLYGLYQKDESELLKKIKQISRALHLLTQVIAHGDMVAPMSEQDLKAYKFVVQKQIEGLTTLIKGLESNNTHEDIGLHIDQFHHDATAVLEEIGIMQALPTLDSEKQALEEHVEAFESLEHGLVKNPSRGQVIKALHEARDLLGGINKTLDKALNHPLVNIARCGLEGSVVAMELIPPRQAPSAR